MARIRTIKPEFWTSEQIVACSPMARLLFIGLWNFCDDGGRIPFSPQNLKMRIFPGDDISSENVRGLIGELSSNDRGNPLVVIYDIEGKQYLQVTGWDKHQRIERPNYQFPDVNGVVPPNVGYRNPRPFGDRSPPDLRNGREGKSKRSVSTKVETGARRQSSKKSPTRNGRGRDPPPIDGDLFPGNVTRTAEAELYRRGKEVLGKEAGGFIKKLLKARDGNVSLARADIETASTKDNAGEWIGGVIRQANGGRTSDGWLPGSAIV